MKFSLGDLRSSEALIEELYISLRRSVGRWSKITNQTPQARMGYVGQHLVSVVTGFPGGRSGARGYDLVLPKDKHAEIKTCYKVDQLGECGDCTASVSAIEKACASCGSVAIKRKDDSKWLLAVKTEADFAAALDPVTYYFVLFEFEDIASVDNENIIASIWSVDPTAVGFACGIVDYKLNIQSKSKSGAPFNVWPYAPKFFLMAPTLIYRSVISESAVRTHIFPGAVGKPRFELMPPITELLRAHTLTDHSLRLLLKALGGVPPRAAGRADLARSVEERRSTVTEPEFTDMVARSVYGPLIKGKKSLIPKRLITRAPYLKALA